MTTYTKNDLSEFQIPILKELGPEWGYIRFKGKSYSLHYVKSNKQPFLAILKTYFHREIKIENLNFHRIVFDGFWNSTNYEEASDLLNLMEQRFLADTTIPNIGISLTHLIDILNE